MLEHRFWQLVNKRDKISDEERCLVSAIVNLSVTTYPHLTFEQIFDELLYRRACPSSFVAEHAMKEQLNRIEELLTMVTNATKRIQDDNDAIKAAIADVQTAVGSVQSSMDAANARLEADIASLRNNAGSGDADALNAVADSMEASLTTLKGLSTQLTGIATAEGQIDIAPPPPPPPPPPPATLAISPATVTVSRGSTTQFSANLPGATFSAGRGTIDVGGNYTPPTDPAILSDSVTATSADGTQTSVASVTING